MCTKCDWLRFHHSTLQAFAQSQERADADLLYKCEGYHITQESESLLLEFCLLQIHLTFASMIIESSSIIPLRTNGAIANNAAVAKHPGFAIKFAFWISGPFPFT